MTFDDIATYERIKGEYGRLSSAYNLIKTDKSLYVKSIIKFL